MLIFPIRAMYLGAKYFQCSWLQRHKILRIQSTRVELGDIKYARLVSRINLPFYHSSSFFFSEELVVS